MLTVDFDRLDLRAGDCLLDAGCGTGRHLREAARRGVRVVGIDRNNRDLAEASDSLRKGETAAPGAFLVIRADIACLPFGDETFDTVLCSEVLEHVADCRRAVRELVRVLKPDRDLVVSVPRFFPERVCWLLSRDYHETPGGHVRIFRRREIQGMLEEAGATCLAVRYRHALHAPYWWLRCIAGPAQERSRLVAAYRRLLEWEIRKHPLLLRIVEETMSPFLAKSLVLYLKKG